MTILEHRRLRQRQWKYKLSINMVERLGISSFVTCVESEPIRTPSLDLSLATTPRPRTYQLMLAWT